MVVLGVRFQDNNRFTHVREKLIKANKCMYVIRTLKAEGYSHVELNHLFNSLIITIVNHGLFVYGCSQAELNTIQRFLDRCYRRNYITEPVNVYDLLEKQDKSSFKIRLKPKKVSCTSFCQEKSA